MKRLDGLDLTRLHGKAPAVAGVFYAPDIYAFLIRAVKNGAISEDRAGLYLTEAQCRKWQE